MGRNQSVCDLLDLAFFMKVLNLLLIQLHEYADS